LDEWANKLAEWEDILKKRESEVDSAI
jgi:hypothetical protein